MPNCVALGHMPNHIVDLLEHHTSEALSECCV